MALSNTDRVRVELEHRIASGDLPPGSAIDEALLCTFFRVSRTPVREALLQLAATGQVRIAPRAGIFVTQHTIAELEEMLETLALLEGACTQLAAHRISNAQIRELGRLQKRGAAALQAAASHVLSGAESLRRVAQAHPDKWEFDKRERYSWLNAHLNPLSALFMRH